jgi:sucrose-6-phosphate hydrolase SacC (GH32 family)
MVVGADTETEALVPLYEAEDDSLTRWKYRGILFRLPKEKVKFFECPNFFKVDGKWMLICAPYRPLEYWIGSFDLDTLKSKPENQGILDAGITMPATLPTGLKGAASCSAGSGAFEKGAAGTKVPLSPDSIGENLDLRIFLDRSVREVFAEEGRLAVTRVIYPDENAGGIEVFAKGGPAEVTSVEIWPMQPVWDK